MFGAVTVVGMSARLAGVDEVQRVFRRVGMVRAGSRKCIGNYYFCIWYSNQSNLNLSGSAGTKFLLGIATSLPKWDNEWLQDFKTRSPGQQQTDNIICYSDRQCSGSCGISSSTCYSTSLHDPVLISRTVYTRLFSWCNV